MSSAGFVDGADQIGASIAAQPAEPVLCRNLVVAR
jgi:hypothetical protein